MADTGVRAGTVATGLEGITLPPAAGVARLSVADVGGRAILRAARDVAARLHTAAGLALPEGINRAATAPAGASLQLGPDEWLILAPGPDGRRGAIVPDNGEPGGAHALVEVSHRTIGLILEGEAVENVLAEGCPLPLESAAFPMGRATRTLLGKVEIVLWRVALDRFHIEVARSFGPYLVAFLAQAIRTEAALAGGRRG